MRNSVFKKSNSSCHTTTRRDASKADSPLDSPSSPPLASALKASTFIAMAPSLLAALDEVVGDSELSLESIKPPRKRKSITGGTSAAKKAKVVSLAGPSSNIGVLDKRLSVLATSVISNGVEFYKDAENQEDAAETVVKLAQYTKQLETALAQSKSAGSATKGATTAKQMTRAELEAEAEKIRKAAVSGIKKQMTVRVSSFQSPNKITDYMTRLVEAELQNKRGQVDVRWPMR